MRSSGLLVIFLLSGALLICVSGQGAPSTAQKGNNYFWGQIKATSRFFQRIPIIRRARFGQIITENYVFTQAAAPANIDAIRVTDRKTIGGATAALTAGGPGVQTATITFTSQRGMGINSVIEIYLA